MFRAPSLSFPSFGSSEEIAGMTLLGETLRERGAFPDPDGRERPVAAVLRLPLELLTNAGNHTRLLARVGCRSPDRTALHLDGLGPETGRRRAVCALRVALLLQDRGQPCSIVCSGPLRWVFLAFGVAGLELTPGRCELLRPLLPTPERFGRFAFAPPRFDFPSLMCTLPPAKAATVLRSGIVPERECPCPGCAGRDLAERVADATTHNLFTMLRHSDGLAGVPPVERVRMLEAQLKRALSLHRHLHMRGVWRGDEPLIARLLHIVEKAKAYDLLEERLRTSRRQAA